MTEEEKRQLALSIIAAKQQRNFSQLADAQSQLNAALRRSAEQQRALTSLAQQGITWQQLKMAHDESPNTFTIYMLLGLCQTFVQ